jgi:hypothetical protein
MRSAEGTAKVGDVPLDFPKVEARLMIRHILLHKARIDVVKRNPLEDILRRIPKHNNSGISYSFDHFPVGPQQPTWRQRDDAIEDILASENGLQGLRRCEAEIVQGQIPALKSLDRRSEKTFDFSVEVEKPIFKKTGKMCTYRGLADAADAADEYTHVLPFR